MTLKIFDGTNWQIGQRLKVFRTSLDQWVRAKKISSWRGDDTNGYWSIIYPDFPAAIATVNITGTGAVGQPLNLSNVFVFDLSDYRVPDSITYQWQISPNNSSWSDISGATGASYTPSSTDINSYIRCQITAQNERTLGPPTVPVVVTTSNTVQVFDPAYSFAFGQEFGVNANGFIMFDRTNGVFPNSESYLIDSNGNFINSRILGYFMGGYRFYDLAYKSDDNYFRLYVRMYRDAAGSTRPSLPPVEYEIVFNNFTNPGGARPEPREFADIYVSNESDTADISNYYAYLSRFGQVYQTYSSSQYALGRKFTVPMNSFSSIASSFAPPSNSVNISTVSISSNVATITTSSLHNLTSGEPVTIYGLTGSASVLNGTRQVTGTPADNRFTISVTASNLSTTSVSGAWCTYPPGAFANEGGWIYIGSYNTSSNATIPFTAGTNQASEIGAVQTFNKQNMFMPNGITGITFSNSTTNGVTISWQNTNSTLYPLLNAKSYKVEVRRTSDQLLITSQVPVLSNSLTISSGLVLGTGYSVTVTPNSRSDGRGQFYFGSVANYAHALKPAAPTNVTGTAGNAQVSLSWTAPASNGATITSYKIQYSSNSGTTWSPTTPIDTGGSSTSYTVTGLSNGTAYIFRVAAVNSIGQGDWSANSAAITPAVVATRITLSASATPIFTLGNTSTITAQLKDGNGNNILESGRSITFSLDTGSPSDSSLNVTSATTNSSGQATTTLTSGSSGGTAKVRAKSSGLTDGTVDVVINLRDARTPTLTATGLAKGVKFDNTNHDSNWSYGIWSGPTVGSLESGDSYNNSTFDILVPVVNNTRPTVSVNTSAKSATCVMSPNGTDVWAVNRSTSVQIFSSRAGYFVGFSNTSTGTSARTSTRTFLWQFSTDGGSTWRTDWPAAFTINRVDTWNTQTLSWTGTPNSRKIRCRVTLNTNDGFTDTVTTSNEPTIP